MLPASRADTAASVAPLPSAAPPPAVRSGRLIPRHGFTRRDDIFLTLLRLLVCEQHSAGQARAGGLRQLGVKNGLVAHLALGLLREHTDLLRLVGEDKTAAQEGEQAIIMLLLVL